MAILKKIPCNDNEINSNDNGANDENDNIISMSKW